MNPIVNDGLFRQLIEEAPMAVAVVSDVGRLVYVNQALLTMLDYRAEELMGKPIEVLLPVRLQAGHVGQRTEYVSQPERRPMGKGRDLVALCRTGAEIPVEVGLYPVHLESGLLVAATVVDISERLHQQAVNERHDRLESVGFLAGGLAHDYNNVLAGILGNAEVLARNPSLDAKGRERIESIRRLVDKGAQIARRLITFSKGGRPVLQVHDLGPLVREAAETAVSGTSVVIRWLLPEAPLLARVDQGQWGQVVTNLVINAVQALAGPGTILVSADAVTQDQGRFLQFEIHDDGPGIPANLLDKVLEPFFTTKPGGSGLGLAIVHSIVEQHGGTLTVRSSLGAGTSFTILLPAAIEAPEFGVVDRTPEPAVCHEVGRVLVLDDNDDLRDSMASILEHCGFDVVTARDGEEALEKLAQGTRDGLPFEVLLLDVIVPGHLGGLDVVRTLERQNQAVPTVFMSGYSEDDLKGVLAPGRHGFLHKPFGMGEMLSTLSRLLAG